VDMPYIYVLFFSSYPPDFSREPVVTSHDDGNRVFTRGVSHFDRYWFRESGMSYRIMPQGVFVFPGNQMCRGRRRIEFSIPNGSAAYNVFVNECVGRQFRSSVQANGDNFIPS